MSYKPISICYFPGRESTYVRTRVFLNGMRQAGIIVFDCSYPKKKIYRNIISFFKFLKYKNKSDIILIGFLGHFFLPFVKLFTRKKIIFEAFLSTYQTLAFDRKSIKPHGFLAKIIRFIEHFDCQLADLVLLDTNQHIQYFIDQYQLNRIKFRRSLLSCDDKLMTPRLNISEDQFIVHFHGEFQALHGAKYIIEAASFIPHVQFRMIGGGKEWQVCYQLAQSLKIKNIEFIPPVRFDIIPEYISSASICLGIFGETQKTQLVIPFKVYETLSMAKPIITADSPAIRELLSHNENVYLCEAANPKSLADAIETLRNDKLLRKKIAENGYRLFKENCTPKIIGEQILEWSNDLLKPKSN